VFSDAMLEKEKRRITTYRAAVLMHELYKSWLQSNHFKMPNIVGL